jgi:rRNA biogenesis protein RRP5
MEVIQGNADRIRGLFERILQLHWQPVKMKFFFKKYLEYEKKYGDEASIQHVKDLATQYVASLG